MLVALSSGCTKKNNICFNKSVSTDLFQYQSVFDTRLAIASLWERKVLIQKHSEICSDTIFLIERIDEPSLQAQNTIWTSKRDMVLDYSREGALKNTMYKYSDWSDPLKNVTERFDTLSIRKVLLLGGYRTFITQIIPDKGINTFCFSDDGSVR